jgi:hypothetical protein
MWPIAQEICLQSFVQCFHQTIGFWIKRYKVSINQNEFKEEISDKVNKLLKLKSNQAYTTQLLQSETLVSIVEILDLTLPILLNRSKCRMEGIILCQCH